VFVLQVSGKKRWIVYEPVVRLPLASQPQAGGHLVPDGAEPLLDVELEAGDALYLPRGYVHAALTTDVASVHLTVGVLSTTWFDVLSDAVSLAGADEAFRDALPILPLETLSVADFLRQAAAWLEQLPAADVEAVVARRLRRALPLEPVGLLAQDTAVRGLTASASLRPRRGLVTTFAVDGDSVVVTLPGRTLTLPALVEPALRRLLLGHCTPADLQLGGLDGPGALVLARRLLREGVVVPA